LDDITPNELQTPEPPPAADPNPLPFQRPAEYYSNTESRLRPLLPRWVPIGCGWLSLVFVIGLFAAGTLAPKSGVILDMLFGKIQDDLVQHFTKDVTAAQKTSFAAEMKTMRTAARDGKLKLDRTQKLLRLATELDGDEKIDQAEAGKLIAAVRDVNQGVK
jgi:hypothetical protein